MTTDLAPVESLLPTTPLDEAMAIIDVARCRELLRPLNEEKRKFLRMRALTGTDADAARLTGKAATVAKYWRRNDANFRAAYDALLLEPVVHAMAELQMLAPKAVGVIASQLDSVHGPTAQKAAEMVLKSKGIGILSNLNVELEDKSGNAFMDLLTKAMSSRKQARVQQAAADYGDDGNTIEAEGVREI